MIFGVILLAAIAMLVLGLVYLLGGLWLGVATFGLGLVAYILTPIITQLGPVHIRKRVGDIYGSLGLSAIGEALLVWRGAAGYSLYKLGYDAEEDTMYYKHQGEKREVFDTGSWMSYLFGRPFGLLSDGPGDKSTAEVRTPLVAEVTQAQHRMSEDGLRHTVVDGVHKVARYAKLPERMAVIDPGSVRFHGSAKTTTKEQAKESAIKSQSGYAHQMSNWRLLTLVTAFIVTFIIVLLLGPDAFDTEGGEWQSPINESVITGSVDAIALLPGVVG